MAEPIWLTILLRSVEEFNQWRRDNPSERIKSTGLVLSGNFSGTNFAGVYLPYVRFLEGSNLRNTNFEGACLCAGEFCWVDLEGANFKGADLEAARFTGSNLKDTNLEGAGCCGATFIKAHLEGSSLEAIRRMQKEQDEYHRRLSDVLCKEAERWTTHMKVMAGV